MKPTSMKKCLLREEGYSEDYIEGFKEGFKIGYQEGLQEADRKYKAELTRIAEQLRTLNYTEPLIQKIISA